MMIRDIELDLNHFVDYLEFIYLIFHFNLILLIWIFHLFFHKFLLFSFLFKILDWVLDIRECLLIFV